jgi:hypothetical protein
MAIYSPTDPQTARIQSKVRTLSTPPNTVVRSCTLLLCSEIELTIPSPSFHTHTTPDPTVTSDFLDSESNTEPGSPSPLHLTPLSSLTLLGTITPTQTASPPRSPNMTANPPRMPIRGQNLAPKFKGTAPSLNRFFSDFEYLADISQLTKAQKKRDIVRYLSTKDADFWTQ